MTSMLIVGLITGGCGGIALGLAISAYRFAQRLKTTNPVYEEVTLRGDSGEAESLMYKTGREYHRRMRRPPNHLVIGVDLYEHLVINNAHRSDYDHTMALCYQDTFMGVPLVVVSEKGFVAAAGAPHDVLMRYGGTPKGGAQT